jgi:hypothetical protein
VGVQGGPKVGWRTVKGSGEWAGWGRGSVWVGVELLAQRINERQDYVVGSWGFGKGEGKG